jgi:hypothetical protein
MTHIDDTLVAIAYVRQSDQVPGLLARVAAAYGMKTVAYLGTGTLDRKVPHGRFHLESARYKLGASSNTHAATIAFKSGPTSRPAISPLVWILDRHTGSDVPPRFNNEETRMILAIEGVDPPRLPRPVRSDGVRPCFHKGWAGMSQFRHKSEARSEVLSERNSTDRRPERNSA